VAVDTADNLVAAVADKLRPLAGVSAATVRDILATADRAFQRPTEPAPADQLLRWRRAIMPPASDRRDMGISPLLAT